MGAEKRYGNVEDYERKLATIMEKFGIPVEDYNWNYDRHGGFVEFRYKGTMYRFEHTVEKARANGEKLNYGSDAFTQIVLALEDLARIVRRGIYDLQQWVQGMKFLPEANAMPPCFRILGFDQMPETKEQVEKQYRKLATVMHPDTGGSTDDFVALQNAKKTAIQYLEQLSK